LVKVTVTSAEAVPATAAARPATRAIFFMGGLS
jgi:hypothetical protein